MIGTDAGASLVPIADGASRQHVRAAAFAFVGLTLQVVSIVAVASKLGIANAAFERSLPVIAVAFVIHYWLPQRLRLPFFALLSIGLLGFVLGCGARGWEPVDALQRTAIVVIVGSCLIAICRLKLPFWVRVSALVCAAGVLAFWRVESIAHPIFGAIWPVLGSMFMFRLMLYVYEVEHQREPPGMWQTIAYFFMLPNVCFPLSPVVDWRAFGREYYNGEPIRIYQTGLRWIVRGLIQCIGYELISSHAYLDAASVTDGEQLARYLFSNYGLYLRVSGHFHIVAGVLHLFGWNLGETNHQYYLANSFTDYWRRVNIYWKELILTLFYNPVAYRVRRTSAVRAVLAGSVAAFIATWFLHGYQAFWLTGGFRFSLPDALFWAILGGLVIANANREAKRPRVRQLVRKFDLRQLAASSLRTVGVFATLCLLWSLWSCSSLSAWVELWQHFDAASGVWLLLGLLSIFVCKFAVESVEVLGGALLPHRLRGGDGQPRQWVIALFTCALPLGLLWLTQGTLFELTRAPETRQAPRIGASLREANEYSTGRGYYEDLIELSAPRW